ncbi:pyruvate kinase [Arenibacter sp. N53]|uniref:pyruvate kinase n=1 Tax=Arenibacter TaxID=178469 RepID=UPI000CD3FA45|nr:MULTISPECIES: pyruvate kinase [Arenibacter]MCM4154021.1 pyruvate kinase [Arenibacter sp. N53]
MEDLKVGDKLYNVSQNGFGDFFRYSFSEVVRLTKTLAVLDNGERLRNKPVRSLINGDIGFALASNKWVYWHMVSSEIEQLAQEEKEKIVINDWFKDRIFSGPEKRMIYNLFKEKGILKGADINLEKTIELFK